MAHKLLVAYREFTHTGAHPTTRRHKYIDSLTKGKTKTGVLQSLRFLAHPLPEHCQR